ncbi:hypothetical protein ACGVWS_01240 [Enterobacteriaceae bacterium LUAb1]
MSKKSITLTPLTPFDSHIEAPGFSFCDNENNALYVLSNGFNPTSSTGLAKIDINDPSKYTWRPYLSNCDDTDRDYPFAFDYSYNDLFVSINGLDTNTESFIFRTKLTKDYGNIGFINRIKNPANGGATYTSVAYDKKQKKLFAITNNNSSCWIEVFNNNTFSYKIETDHTDILSITIDEELSRCYFFPAEEKRLGYFSTTMSNPEITYLDFPDEDILYGNKNAYDHINKRMFIPALSNEGSSLNSRYVSVLDTKTNTFIKNIQYIGELASFDYLVFDSVRQIVFSVTSSVISKDLYVTPIDAITLDYAAQDSISIPDSAKRLVGFAIKIGEKDDIIYGLGVDGKIYPTRIDFI